MKFLWIVIGIILVLILFPMLLSGIHEARTAEYTQLAPNVATSGNETTAYVITLKRPFSDDLASVVSITSNVTADTPFATSFSNPVLTIDGLALNQTRNLTIIYEYESLESSAGTILGLLPLLVIVGIVVAVIFAGYKTFGR